MRVGESWKVMQGAAGAAVTLLALAPAGAQRQEPEMQRWVLRGGGQRDRSYPGMGLQPSSPEDFRKNAHFRIAARGRSERPEKFMLTEYLPPVGDQGQQSSCVGWATGYYCYTYGVAKQRKFTPEQLRDKKFQFSPAFIYHLGNGGKDDGMKIAVALQILKERGCATEAEMPYSEKDFLTPPPTAAEERAGRYKTREVANIFKGQPFGEERPDPEKMKAFLVELKQPFALGIPIFKDFPSGNRKVGKGFGYELTIELTEANWKDNWTGNHAITIIGYDDSKKAFRMVNSWGPGWGDQGQLWISEEFLCNWGMDAWGQVSAGGPVARWTGREPVQLTKSVTLEPPADRAGAPAR